MTDDDLYHEARSEAAMCNDRSLSAKIGHYTRKVMAAVLAKDEIRHHEAIVRRRAFQDEQNYRRFPSMGHLDE